MSRYMSGNTYDDLKKMHGDDGEGQKYPRRKLGNNTYSYSREDNEGRTVYEVELHGHDIVRLHEDGRVEVNLQGWGTQTTRQRINQFLPQGYSVYVRSRVNFFMQPDGIIEEMDDYTWYATASTKAPAGSTLWD